MIAAGAKVLIDRDRFRAGIAIFDQMDAIQDQAEIQIMVLSPDYMASKACLHEMYRAISTDPSFTRGGIIPLLRVQCQIPNEIASFNPLHVNLTNDADSAQWDILLQACGLDLRSHVPDWLFARRQVRMELVQKKCVNLLVESGTRRAEFLARLRQDLGSLPEVDLDSGKTAPRRGLVSEVLNACGVRATVPRPPEDLAMLTRKLEELKSAPIICLRHFDRVSSRKYGPDLFSALYYLVVNGKLILLIESREHYSKLLPHADGGAISYDLPLTSVRLKGRT